MHGATVKIMLLVHKRRRVRLVWIPSIIKWYL